LLDIRVLLRNNPEGKVVVQSKVRGRNKFISMVLQEIAKLRPNMTSTDVGITHFANPVDAEFIKRELLEKLHVRKVLINDMGIIMATYAGNNGMIVSF